MRRSPNITVMIRAAEKAGRGLVRDFGEVENLQVSQKGPSDFVSVADTKAERTIREELLHARPTYGLLMEESGAIEGSDPDHRWIVDPLDGTSNFLHGIPHFAISIGLERAGDIVAGVVYHPVTDELFWAEKNTGAYLRDRRIRVSARRRLADAVIGTGIPHRGGIDPAPYLDQLGRVMAETAGVRRFGAAALDLAYVAAGRLDGFWESNLSAWDLAAGLILIREAGGFASDMSGRNRILETGSVVAANAHLHSPLHRLLAGGR